MVSTSFHDAVVEVLAVKTEVETCRTLKLMSSQLSCFDSCFSSKLGEHYEIVHYIEGLKWQHPSGARKLKRIISHTLGYTGVDSNNFNEATLIQHCSNVQIGGR